MAYVKKYIGRGDYRTVWEPDINQSVDSNKDEAIAYANNNLSYDDKQTDAQFLYGPTGGSLTKQYDKIFEQTNANLFGYKNPSYTYSKQPSDMSAPQQNTNPFKTGNMSPQQVINMAYRLGGGTYAGAVKVASQYGVDLNSIVSNRDKARRVSSSPKAQQASSTITNVITETTNKQASAPASISYEGYRREPLGYIRWTTYNYPQKIDIKFPDPVLRAMEKTGYYSKK